MDTDHSRTLLFVVGMHRSGTSALCAALAACGASFGEGLLEAMPGVNDEGFWEDEEVVAVNERLLSILGANWYSLSPDPEGVDWEAPRFDEPRKQALALIERGFGASAGLEAVKDPRLCITLPFWLACSAEAQVRARVIVISRPALEVANSLYKRDAFPLSYGMRLVLAYRRLIERHAPADTVYVTYDALLADPLALMGALALEFPLTVDGEALALAVRSELRHQGGTGAPEPAAPELAALEAEIETRYPVVDALEKLAETLVARGEQLTRIGEQHSVTLATLDERDRDVASLTAEHKHALSVIEEREAHLKTALATIDERDEQIREFDRRLSKLGDEHSYALNLIQSRDEQLQRVFAKPGIGYLFKAMWKHESR